MRQTFEKLVSLLSSEDLLEEGMSTYSSILAWRIPMTEEPGRLQSIGWQRVWHDWSDLAHTQAHMHMYISWRVCETYWKGNREEGDIKVLVWHLKHRAGWDHLKQEHSEKIKIVFQDSNIWSEMKELKFSCSVMSNSLQPRGLQPTRILHPWDFPGKSTGVGCHFLLQRIFPTSGLNPGLPHCRQTLTVWATREVLELRRTSKGAKEMPIEQQEIQSSVVP